MNDCGGESDDVDDTNGDEEGEEEYDEEELGDSLVICDDKIIVGKAVAKRVCDCLKRAMYFVTGEIIRCCATVLHNSLNEFFFGMIN